MVHCEDFSTIRASMLIVPCPSMASRALTIKFVSTWCKSIVLIVMSGISENVVLILIVLGRTPRNILMTSFMTKGALMGLISFWISIRRYCEILPINSVALSAARLTAAKLSVNSSLTSASEIFSIKSSHILL